MTYLEIYQIAKRLVSAELRRSTTIFLTAKWRTWQSCPRAEGLAPWRPPRAHHHLIFRGDPGLFNQPYRAAI